MNDNLMKMLKPAKGLVVRDPVSKQKLDENGEIKPWVGPEGRYWRRRVNCGDAFIVQSSKKKK
jgi:hypothetical protein